MSYLKKFLIRLVFMGNKRYCPICRKSARMFRSAGVIRRHDALCPSCGSVERHRLAWLYLMKVCNFYNSSNIKMLHIAPEYMLAPLFREIIGDGYLSADLSSPSAMVKMDITSIQYPSNSFDIIYCSHVLEHVTDDRLAMKELCRVLKKDGYAILLVPIDATVTYEDFTITDPAGRLEAFGDETHVRLYGPDYIDRLKEAGFSVQVANPSQFLSPQEMKKMGITKEAGEIYFCTKK